MDVISRITSAVEASGFIAASDLIADTGFCSIFASVPSETRIAFTTATGSSGISPTTAASLATCLPEPMAVPTDSG